MLTAIVMLVVGLYMSTLHVALSITIIVAVVCGISIYLYMAFKVLNAKIDDLTNTISEMTNANESALHSNRVNYPE